MKKSESWLGPDHSYGIVCLEFPKILLGDPVSMFIKVGVNLHTPGGVSKWSGFPHDRQLCKSFKHHG